MKNNKHKKARQILSDPHKRAIAIQGALKQGKYDLALSIMIYGQDLKLQS